MKIEIIGGAYHEECSFPPREINRGSGVRAASVISSLGASAHLHTATGGVLRDSISEIASNNRFELTCLSKNEDIRFHYSYPLARPKISLSSKYDFSDEVVQADNVLVFGMLEGRIRVEAKRAVYDPQDGVNSRPFGEDGSTADELAMVVSYSEGVALTGLVSPSEIATSLLDLPNATIVIVKCGPQGALVATKNNQNWIGAFPTRRVYKIGSGDVFTAAFAHQWLCCAKSPLEAAWFASRTVAAYVEQGLDRFDVETINLIAHEADWARNTRTLKHARQIPDGKIYLAGPFFTTSQRWVIDEARSALMDMGFNVISPVHDIGMGGAEDVVLADLFELDNAKIVLAMISDMDPGTLFEIGYARARGIPVVAVAEQSKESDVTMLLGSGCSVVTDLTTGLYYACWQLMGDV